MILSRYARAALRSFLAHWVSRKLKRAPLAVRVAQEAEREARLRNDTRAIGRARQQLRLARHEGLRQELGWKGQ